jgi:hypothetical protein
LSFKVSDLARRWDYQISSLAKSASAWNGSMPRVPLAGKIVDIGCGGGAHPPRAMA